MPERMDTPDEIARTILAQRELNFAGGILVVNPIPEEYAMPKETIDCAIAQALKDAESQGIKGKNVTPFLLGRVVELTGGDSLKSNIQLVFSNVLLAAQIAKAMNSH